MTTALDRIVEYKQREVAALKAVIAPEDLAAMAADTPPRRDFVGVLRNAHATQGVGLIAEVKRASPSAGVIRDPFHPGAAAQAYERGGAAAISVLTDAPSFGGGPEALLEARDHCALPALRKDFILDPFQVTESSALAADCILLIASILDDDTARRCIDEARRWNMAVLFEVHDEEEMARAHHLEVDLVGINNRDLKRMITDLSTTERLAPLAPEGCPLVSESGIRSPDDVRAVTGFGATAILVGEHLMRQTDIEQGVKKLLGTAAIDE